MECCTVDMCSARTVVDNCEQFRREPRWHSNGRCTYIAQGMVETDSVSRDEDAMMGSMFVSSAIVSCPLGEGERAWKVVVCG